ncbi:tetratricopeptide repeat protein [Yoonia sp.]|uniref:tetratricopeptide repeat protein n=1 Tax=Yoonia sp. TaxID=2212373 RepID=UPI0025CCC24D|nr:tetratricopeptide repeat protein [Yoonia sp.]
MGATVFAPTDAAFAALPAGTVESLLLPESKDTLVAILTCNVVPGAVTPDQLVDRRQDVATADIIAANGVIQVIDTALLPNQAHWSCRLGCGDRACRAVRNNLPPARCRICKPRFVALVWPDMHQEGFVTVFRRSISAAVLACLLCPATAALADPDSGAYLAARQAGLTNDFARGARYFTKGLIADPGNAALLENALTSYVALGQVDRAIPIAQVIVDLGYQSQIANIVLSLSAVKSGDWDYIFSALEEGRSIGPLVDGLAQAWAHMGEGEMVKALASFDQVIEADEMKIYGLTHKAYALATVGDFEAAEAVFAESATGGLRYSRRSAMAHAQILSQLDRNDDAVAIIEGVFGTQLDAGVAALRAALIAGTAVAYDAVASPTEGIADIYHVIAGAVQGDAPDAYTLLYARAATYLAPGNTQAVLMTARLLDDLGQYDLANTTYTSVSRDDPAFDAAELGRAEVLRAAGRDDAAIEVLDALARSHPDLPQVHAARGDTLRQVKRYEEAAVAYSRALALYSDDSAAKWFVYYTRAISNHLLENWPAAELDFRAALVLRPGQPQVLNYLGYSLVERGEKLDEALGMIEAAAAARPDNGAIMDSLGWVMFQLGHYDEAVGHMELAASLEPVDPVINDHLGDVYWAVGRENEAQFQWQRALSFDPDAADAGRIRDKLARGLDLVRRDEGLDPIRVARGDN